jgi:hypothetical protein
VTWAAGLIVAIGAGVATAHGLYEVALAAGVTAKLAWLWPIITDGLALVAYASVARLSNHGRTYAWAVVVLAAGLSGLAQAIYLAGGVDVAPPALRFGIGAWPAIAAAIVAHLLFLLRGSLRPVIEQDVPMVIQPEFTAVEAGTPVQGSYDPCTPIEGGNVHLTQYEYPMRVAHPDTRSPARDRAVASAQSYRHQHGQLPTVSQLMKLAQVARGTAGSALKELRVGPSLR